VKEKQPRGVLTLAMVEMSADPALATWASEVCREAVNNAIRHGQASAVKLTVEVVDAGLDITATDGGHGVPDGYHQGLGLVMMDQTCRHWNPGNRAKGGAVMTASLT
jgi:signal transduction histidine kinase